MKKIYITFLGVLASLTYHAQLTQNNHALANNDNFITYQCDSLGISLVGSGANTVWNYSTIATHSSMQSNYVASNITNASYPSANIGVVASLSNSAYYNSAPSTLKYYGGNLTVGPVSATLNYTLPAIFAVYPMALNSFTTSSISGSVAVTAPITTNGTFSGTCTVIVDASGTLTLPGTSATFTDVFRVVTSQTIDITTPFANANLVQTNYEYFGGGIKGALFTISTATAVVLGSPTTQTIVTRNKNATTTTQTLSLTENRNLGSEVLVYPNPGTTFVNVVTENKNADHVLIYEITGKLITTQNLVDGKVRLDVSNFNNGLYIYSIQDHNNQTIRSGKITVQ